MKLKPKIIREIKNNKNPILMNQNYVHNIPAYEAIGLDTLIERALIINFSLQYQQTHVLLYE